MIPAGEGGEGMRGEFFQGGAWLKKEGIHSGFSDLRLSQPMPNTPPPLPSPPLPSPPLPSPPLPSPCNQNFARSLVFELGSHSYRGSTTSCSTEEPRNDSIPLQIPTSVLLCHGFIPWCDMDDSYPSTVGNLHGVRSLRPLDSPGMDLLRLKAPAFAA